MEAALLQLESSPRDTELLNTIFRGAHSIKGASTTFGIDEVGRFTHVLENLLERLRDGLLETTGPLVELLLTSVDVIDGLIANAKDGAPLPANLEHVFLELQRVNGSTVSQANAIVATTEQTHKSKLAEFRIQLKPSPEFFRFGQEPILLIRELSELGSLHKVSIDARSLPCLSEIQPEECYVAWEIVIATERPRQAVEDVFMFLDEGSKYSIECLNIVVPSEETVASSNQSPNNTTQPAVVVKPTCAPSESSGDEDKKNAAERVSNKNSTAARGAENETVRVDRQRLDELINQIGELVIGASMVEQELLSIAGGHGLESMSALGKIVRDLQEMSLGLRMVPIAATFQKMNRVIRDVAKKVGKQIQFVTEGDDTELDKTVVDQISDPLVHMVRNAADHGIEPPDTRLANGKSAEGTVKLRAYQQGGNVYIELTDDGRGLDRKRIVDKAIERGILTAESNPSDAEICNLIFQPGFSTAKEVTDVSGRGVGMDVVRRNVEALQGSVSIKSTEGVGSTITVRLPLTLAILDGLLVRLSSEVFVIPLLSVIESICIRTNEIHKIVGVGEVITLRGEVVPLLRLHRLLNIAPTSTLDDQGLLVLVEDQGRRMALFVDELLGQQQVVIKNLETNFRKVPGVAGATILGDGRVALILDTFGVSNLGQEEAASPKQIAASPSVECFATQN
jgi:two-component system chemotaxis sensor kinase CheA